MTGRHAGRCRRAPETDEQVAGGFIAKGHGTPENHGSTLLGVHATGDRQDGLADLGEGVPDA
ncbi:MAG: hypothetical protein BGP00_14870 [Novosphingobium sp. 63-713]|nr:MAG: hypothetical protein BGP00_14870 [Novosphingobium sp. 63-713]